MTLRKFAGTVAIAAACLFVLASPALAQAVAAAPDAASVKVPVGTWVPELLGFVESMLGVILTGLLTVIAAHLPAAVRGYVNAQSTAAVEQLLEKAIRYGFNAVDGAIVGKTLDIPIGSQVAAAAVQYAIDNGPGKLIAWAGGADGIKRKILARLPLGQNVTAPEVAAAVPAPEPAAQ